MNLGILSFRRGLYGPAEAELQWVCRRDHDHAVAHFYRGAALTRLGRVEEALAMLERAVHIDPMNGRAFHTLGLPFDRTHMKEEAAEMYHRSRELSGL